MSHNKERYIWVGLCLLCAIFAVSSQQPRSEQPPAPLFVFQGTPAEIPQLINNAAVIPAVAPPGIQGKLVMRGKGSVSFNDRGVSFGLSGQQNRDVAFVQFQGKDTGALFDPRSAGEISFTVTSGYSYQERQALLKIPPGDRDFRTVFQVYQALVQVFSVAITARDGRLSFGYRLGGSDGIYAFPRGQEDALFGKGRTANVRMTWDGKGHGQFFVNDKLAQSTEYNARTRLTWTADASFSIGASDRHNYSGGFYACDEAISRFKVWNKGPTAGMDVPKVTLLSPAANATVSGVIALHSSGEESLAAISSVSYLVDGQDVSGPVYYPYFAYVDTRALANGKHKLEVVARGAGNAESRQAVELTVSNANPADAASDRMAPEPVTGMTADLVSAHSIRLSWNVAADNVGAVAYDLYRDGKLLWTIPAPAPAVPARVSYQDDGRSPSTVYAYQVQSRDAAGNLSPLTAPFELTTKAKDGRILRVGPGGEYKTPCAAFRSAREWDTVEIDAAGNDNYAGDVCAVNVPRLTIRGVHGRAHIDAFGQNAAGKALWLITGDDTIIENVELSGCTVPDRNGAGVRFEGKGLTLRSVYFHDNQNGVLTSSIARGRILIEYSEFSYNGDGTGQSHNLYIGGADELMFRYNYSHHALGGQLLKTRAKLNTVTCNRLTDETGRASYELDFSNGGASYVTGNILQQSAFGENDTFIAYGREKILKGYEPRLYVVNNTFINLARSGRLVVSPSEANILFQNNLISGPGTLPVAGPTVTVQDNVVAPMSIFPEKEQFEFRPAARSAAARAGNRPAVLPNGVSLNPACEYWHPTGGIVRPPSDHPDAGALEIQNSSRL